MDVANRLSPINPVFLINIFIYFIVCAFNPSNIRNTCFEFFNICYYIFIT